LPTIRRPPKNNKPTLLLQVRARIILCLGAVMRVLYAHNMRVLHTRVCALYAREREAKASRLGRHRIERLRHHLDHSPRWLHHIDHLVPRLLICIDTLTKKIRELVEIDRSRLYR
jgi:hypothetical protein